MKRLIGVICLTRPHIFSTLLNRKALEGFLKNPNFQISTQWLYRAILLIGENNVLYTYMRKIFTFIREAKVELTKVTWPTQDQVMRSTILVVALSGIMAIFLGSLDYGFGYILKTYIGG